MQTIAPSGAANNNPQPGTSGGGQSDPSLHKGPTVVSAAMGNLPDASSQSFGVALGDPGMQTALGTTGQPVAPGTAHKADSSSTSGSPDSPSNLPVAGDSSLNPSTGPVQMAQMANKAAQSEMRIGLNTSAFGSVEVHTVVHANEVGVVIGSEKGDLRSLLASELPGIANSLQQQNLRLNAVNFHQGSGFSGNSSPGGDSQARSYTPARAIRSSISMTAVSGDDSGTSTRESARSSSTSLNILA